MADDHPSNELAPREPTVEDLSQPQHVPLLTGSRTSGIHLLEKRCGWDTRAPERL